MRGDGGTDVLPPCGGRVLRQVSTPHFRFTLGENAPLSVLRPHVHEENPGIVFVASGLVEETYAGATLMAGAGDLMLKMHDMRHANRFGPEGARVVIIEKLEPMPFLRDLPYQPALRGGRLVGMVGGLLAKDLGDGREPCEVGLTSFAADLWGMVATRRRSGRSRKIDRAVQMIHDDTGRVRRIDALARGVDAHPVYLARGFRAQFGCSLQGYVMRVRLGRAATLIQGTRRPLADIALAVGFADQAHMTRAFRDYYGRTPGFFRAV